MKHFQSIGARVKVINEVYKLDEEDWKICYQWCKYVYDNGKTQTGYRWIWRKPNGYLQGARGQSCLPDAKTQLELIGKSISEGWGNQKTITA